MQATMKPEPRPTIAATRHPACGRLAPLEAPGCWGSFPRFPLSGAELAQTIPAAWKQVAAARRQPRGMRLTSTCHSPGVLLQLLSGQVVGGDRCRSGTPPAVIQPRSTAAQIVINLDWPRS